MDNYFQNLHKKREANEFLVGMMRTPFDDVLEQFEKKKQVNADHGQYDMIMNELFFPFQKHEHKDDIRWGGIVAKCSTYSMDGFHRNSYWNAESPLCGKWDYYHFEHSTNIVPTEKHMAQAKQVTLSIRYCIEDEDLAMLLAMAETFQEEYIVFIQRMKTPVDNVSEICPSQTRTILHVKPNEMPKEMRMKDQDSLTLNDHLKFMYHFYGKLTQNVFSEKGTTREMKTYKRFTALNDVTFI